MAFISCCITEDPECRRGTEVMGWSQGRGREDGCTRVPELVASGVLHPRKTLSCPSSEDTAVSWCWRFLRAGTLQSHHHMAAELWVQLVPRRHRRMRVCSLKTMMITSAWGIWFSLLLLRMGSRNFMCSKKGKV